MEWLRCHASEEWSRISSSNLTSSSLKAGNFHLSTLVLGPQGGGEGRRGVGGKEVEQPLMTLSVWLLTPAPMPDFRCCHPNVLPLLGFCSGKQFYSLIYPYMANGSLQDRLQGQVRGWVMVRKQDQEATSWRIKGSGLIDDQRGEGLSREALQEEKLGQNI